MDKLVFFFRRDSASHVTQGLLDARSQWVVMEHVTKPTAAPSADCRCYHPASTGKTILGYRFDIDHYYSAKVSVGLFSDYSTSSHPIVIVRALICWVVGFH